MSRALKDRADAMLFLANIMRRVHSDELPETIADAIADKFDELRLAEREACARVAEQFKGGFTASLDGNGNQLVHDPDGPWCLNTHVAEAIRARTTEGQSDEQT